MRVRQVGSIGCAALAACVVAPGDVIAATPDGVRGAQDSVVSVRVGDPANPTRRGAGFVLTSDGPYATAAATVARAQKITIIRNGDEFAAKRIETSAPRGIAVLETTPPGARALPLRAKDPAAGTAVWVLGVDAAGKPTLRVAKIRRVNRVGSIETRGARNIEGQNGGPIVDDQGRVVGVTSPPRPADISAATVGRNTDQSRLAAFRLSKLPIQAKGVRADDGPGFPAVPVAVGLGVLLLGLNLALRFSRRRAIPDHAPSVAGTAMTAGMPAVPAVDPTPAAADPDLEITIKGR